MCEKPLNANVGEIERQSVKGEREREKRELREGGREVREGGREVRGSRLKTKLEAKL